MTSLGVVVPAHDEETLLPRCLDHLARARRRLAHVEPGVTVRVVVALDRCTDHTLDVLATRSEVETVHLDARCVGAARAAGAAYLLSSTEADAIPAGAVDWLACTDADTLVPEHWLIWHLGACRAGYDLLLGTVWPEGAVLTPLERQTWLGRHDLTDGHPHIHGANLGVRASAYRLVGGFRRMDAHEDVDLVSRVRAAGLSCSASGGGCVVTSDRLTGRAVGGFADHLERIRAASVGAQRPA